MKAYIVVQLDVEDAAGFAEYRRLVPSTIAAFGGRYIVRGGECRTLEGTWMPKRLIVLEFESSEDALRWWSSPEYAHLRAMRQASAKTEMILVEGVASQDLQPPEDRRQGERSGL